MGHKPFEILCIDDDRASLNLRRTFLETTLGYHVITATDPQSGLDIFRARHVDAVVTDYQMPGMNGGEFARLVKRARPQVPVIIVSALAALPAQAPRKAIDAFVCKSHPLAVLGDTLEAALLSARRHKSMTRAERVAVALGVLLERVVEAVRPRRPKTVARAEL